MSSSIARWSSMRLFLKTHCENYRIGNRAIAECINSVDRFLDRVVQIAEAELNSENDRRQSRGISPRRTLQDTDIKKAIKMILEEEA